jgi:ABC-type cobalamin transport system permease subunit
MEDLIVKVIAIVVGFNVAVQGVIALLEKVAPATGTDKDDKALVALKKIAGVLSVIVAKKQ